jgi:hypothetical protein
MIYAMQQDITMVYSKFNEEASRVFYSTFNEFRGKVGSVNRNGDENYFQLIRAHFLEQLNKRLNDIALDLIHQFPESSFRNQLQRSLSQSIDYYLEEFHKKAEHD